MASALVCPTPISDSNSSIPAVLTSIFLLAIVNPKRNIDFTPEVKISYKNIETNKHSSRMRTVATTKCQYWWGGWWVCPQAQVNKVNRTPEMTLVGRGLGILDPRSMSGQGGCTIPYDLHVCYVPRHPLWTDTLLWKHYLSATTVAGGNYRV